MAAPQGTHASHKKKKSTVWRRAQGMRLNHGTLSRLASGELAPVNGDVWD